MRIGIVLMFSFLFGLSSFGQLSGDIVRDGRKLVNPKDFEMESHLSGKITFQISVDREGGITSTSIVEKETTVKSTPARINARNYLVENYIFEKGTHYPKFHQGKIILNLIKKE